VVSEPDRTQSQGTEPTGAFRLRNAAPPVMRLSRKVLSGLVVIGAFLLFGALIWALYQGNRTPGGGSELYNTENKTTPDGLSGLPRDYAGVPAEKPEAPAPPRLGPPAPGDLGRPLPAPGGETVDPEQQRGVGEDEAARTSRLFVTTTARSGPRRRPRPPLRPLVVIRRRHLQDRLRRHRSIRGRSSTCRTASWPS
jgi:type IV secretion system protein TrbI